MSTKSITIIKAGLIVGTLDIAAAFINFYSKTGKNPTIILKYIASAIFGAAAMKGAEGMVVAGLLLHYVIAFAFTIFFSLIYSKLWNWFSNTPLIALIYGVFIWIVMNLIIVPSSRAKQIPFTWSAGLINCAILIVCVALPLAYLFHKNKRFF